MKEIHVKREQVAAIVAATFPGYRGDKIQIRPQGWVGFTSLNWSGGSRNEYRAVTLTGGPLGDMSRFNAAYGAKGAEGQSIDIPAGSCVVEHCLFRSKDLGLRIYVRPEDMAPLLPASVELSNLEKLILTYTKERKSSYGGKDRFQQAKEDAGRPPITACGFTSLFAGLASFPKRSEWDAAKASLAERGLLTKAGGITNAGRNAIA